MTWNWSVGSMCMCGYQLDSLPPRCGHIPNEYGDTSSLEPPEPLEMVLDNLLSGEIQQLHDSRGTIDVIFNVANSSIFVKQTMRHPEFGPHVKHETAMHLNRANSTFLDIEGLSDGSVLLSLRVNRPPVLDGTGELSTFSDRMVKWLRVRTLETGFINEERKTIGPLYQNIEHIAGRDKVLQLHFPRSRIRGWKTVALVLLTYRKITVPMWHYIVTTKSLGDIEGLSWEKVQGRMESLGVRMYVEFGPKAGCDVKAKKLHAIRDHAARFLSEERGGNANRKAGHQRPAVLSLARLNSGDLGFRENIF